MTTLALAVASAPAVLGQQPTDCGRGGRGGGRGRVTVNAAQVDRGVNPSDSGRFANLIGKDMILKLPDADADHAPFGITSYSCAMCQIAQRQGQPAVFTFLTEPAVLAVNGSTPIQPGDVIVAVNDHPITTDVGAMQFTYPVPGANVVTVRRGRDERVLHMQVAWPPCMDSVVQAMMDRLGDLSGPGGGRGGGRGRGDASGATVPAGGGRGGRGRVGGGAPTASRERPLVDSLRAEVTRRLGMMADVTRRLGMIAMRDRFGFAVACDVNCVAARASDGTAFFRYERAPAISAVRPDSPAAAAGLKPGDVIVRVDDRSILDESGALALQQAEGRMSLALTVMRDGKEIAIKIARQ